TRAPEAGAEARVAAGSRSEWALGGEGSGSGRGVMWSVGTHLRGMGGSFDYARGPGVDGRIERRVNADLAERSAFAAAQGRGAGGELRARGGAEARERGIPGKGYAPSREARQEMERARGSISWRRAD